MFQIPEGLKGKQELEAKILDVDPVDLEARLQAIGAERIGHFTIDERRYMPTQEMIEAQLSARLRKLTRGQREIVELVLKQKHDPLCIPGHEHIGPRIKNRTEYEVQMIGTGSGECNFKTASFMLDAFGMQLRDEIVTERTRYKNRSIRYEIDRILSYNGETEQLPPSFLEIEGPTPHAIVEAADAIGFSMRALNSRSKRDLIVGHEDGAPE